MRKENRTYYFSVEGDTEQWYLEWLQRMINAEPNARYTVKLDSKIQKDPLSRVKRMTIVGKTEITHIFDYESDEKIHVKQFKTTLERMKEAQNTGKNIKYHLGYSNFKQILSKLTLDHVRKAIVRSKVIMRKNEETGCELQEYRGYRYYKENPSLSLWEQIERILADFRVL